MSNTKIVIILALIVAFVLIVTRFLPQSTTPEKLSQTDQNDSANLGGPVNSLNPLTIESLRKGEYPGSDLFIEQTLNPGSGYSRFIASYKSEGLKIFGLLTVPNGQKPTGGWPVIIFNHGYIPPKEYKTTEKYAAYQDAFAKASYITFKSDLRGHGNSEGVTSSAYGANDYTIDILNAVSSLKKYQDSNPSKIGMWGHSMGGFITLRSMVVSKDIKAGVIWAGVVADYNDLFNNWHRSSIPSSINISQARKWRDNLISQYGNPKDGNPFWETISANYFLKDISGPLQLHHGSADSEVPTAFSEKLVSEMKTAGKEAELFTYPGDNHNLSENLVTALNRSVKFFDSRLKN